MCGLSAFKDPIHMTTNTNTETASGAPDATDEPCPAIGANLIGPMPKEARGRLVERFAGKTKLDPETGCVEWTGALTAGGYGHVRISSGATSETHRAAYVLAHGPIPVGLKVLHSCHNPLCVNPAHLRLGTHGENMQDMVDAGRKPRGRGSNPRKLCPEGALIVIGDQLRGVPVMETARELGVLPWTVFAIRARRLWRTAMSAHIDAFLAVEAAERDRKLPAK